MKKSLLFLSVAAMGSAQAMGADSALGDNTGTNQSRRPRTGLAFERYRAAVNTQQVSNADSASASQPAAAAAASSSDSSRSSSVRSVSRESEPATESSHTQKVYVESGRHVDHNHEPVYTFEPTHPKLTGKDLAGKFPSRVIEIVKNLNRGTKTSPLFLLGAPGTGKSTIAELIAMATGRDFYAFNGDVAACWAGHGVKKVNDLFDAVQNSKRPSIIFLDEVEGIITQPKQSDSSEVTKLLGALKMRISECDRASNSHIFIIIATPTSDNLDEAFLSRFGNSITMESPDLEDRLDIIEQQLAEADSKLEHAPFMRTDFERENLANKIAAKTHNYSRRDIMKIIEQAQQVANDTPSNKLICGNEIILEEHLIEGKERIDTERGRRKESFFKKHGTLENGVKLATLAISLYGAYQAYKQHNLSLKQLMLSEGSFALNLKQFVLSER